MAILVDLVYSIVSSITIEGYIENYYMFVFYIFKSLVLLYILYVFLKSRTTEKEKLNTANNTDYKQASKAQRFLHYGIDLFVSILIFSKYLYTISSEYLIALVDITGERFSQYLTFFVVSVFYYLIFEGIFKITPGKCLTQTRIVNFSTGKVSFGQIVSRTFSRKIPLEAFSFFGKMGWHDSLSKTVVVQQKTSTKYVIWAIVTLIASAILILYGFISYYFKYF